MFPIVGKVVESISINDPIFIGYPYKVKGYFNDSSFSRFFYADAKKLNGKLYGEMINLSDKVLWELLIVAIWRRKSSVAKIVLYLRPNFSISIYEDAIKRSNISLYKFLYGIIPYTKGDPISMSVISEFKMTKFLVELGYVVNSEAYISAIGWSDLRRVKYLTEVGGMKPSHYALHLSYASKRMDIFNYLLEHIERNYQVYVSYITELEYVKILHEKGFPVDKNVSNIAILFNSLETIKFLYEIGCPFSKRDNFSTSNEVDNFMHMKGIGRYSKLCHNSCYNCNLFRSEKIEELWIMEVEEYDSFIQWLPREMIDDVEELCYYSLFGDVN